MKVPKSLSEAFGEEFQSFFSQFLHQSDWIPNPESLLSERFLSRSVLPHIIKLSEMFNRIGDEKSKGLDQYWNQSSNPKNFRLAYNLYFMPSNLFRTASIISELAQKGFCFPKKLQALELGAGPGASMSGLLSALSDSKVTLDSVSAAIIEQDGKQLKFAENFLNAYHSFLNLNAPLVVNPFKRRLDLERGFLPQRAPKFDVILMSFFLNELSDDEKEIQREVSKLYKNHLNENGLIIIIEPALKKQSRKLLNLRKHLIQAHQKDDDFKLLLPCHGTQACGALMEEKDWCHEEVTWWRPPYFRVIDKKARLDRKTLPFSYLVISKSSQTLEELLPRLPQKRSRLVSPLHKIKNRVEFFVCDENLKRKVTQSKKDTNLELDRGDFIEISD